MEIRAPCRKQYGARWERITSGPDEGKRRCIHCGRVATEPERLCPISTEESLAGTAKGSKGSYAPAY